MFKKALEGDDDRQKSLCCDLGCDDDAPIDVDIEYVAIGDNGNHTKKVITKKVKKMITRYNPYVALLLYLFLFVQ